MTTVAVMADPPFEGVALGSLAGELLGPDDAAFLYEAMLGDVCRAVERSGGSLLVNYRPREHLPDVPDTATPRTAVEEVVAEAVDEPGAVRYEVQVGGSHAARIGNTVTHLLDREDEASVHVLEPTAPLVGRTLIDEASMKLRRTPAVVGPATRGRVYYAGFTEPIDFEDVLAPPAVETLVERARAADLGVDFLESLPLVARERDLATLVPVLRARQRAGSIVPARTLAAIEELGLRAVERDGEVVVERT